MGPAAGLDLLQRIYANTNASRDQDHIDAILISRSALIPDRTEYLCHGGVNPADSIFRVVQELVRLGAQVIGIPCNTAHAPPIMRELDRLLDETAHPIAVINMVDAAVRTLLNRQDTSIKVGILATTGSIKATIYQSALRSMAVDWVVPDPVWQDQLQAAIYDRDFGIKAQSYSISSRAIQLAIGTANHLIQDKHATAIILGCTELPLAFAQAEISLDVRVINPTDVLARALIGRVAPEKLLDIPDE